MYTIASWRILLLRGLWEEAESVPSPHQTKINMESQFLLHGGILKCHQHHCQNAMMNRYE